MARKQSWPLPIGQIRGEMEAIEKATLAPYATLSSNSRGRDYPISPDRLRTEFQRDRDRIIHSTAFRRLKHKTQVFMINEGDYYRTRITHTMEVAQVSRTLARALGLNADLAEAIALAHDLGHTPFGHAGEAAFKALLADVGGFEHNEQSLRVVEYLEERYPDIPGLNLTWEVREGIIKHETEYDSPRLDERFCPDESPSLESQLVDLADEIAYNTHDIDDAVKMGLITLDDLAEGVPWLGEIIAEEEKSLTRGAREKFLVYRTTGRLYDLFAMDLLTTTRRTIRRHKIRSLRDARRHPERIVSFSSGLIEQNRQLKDFMMRRVYRHPKTITMSTKAQKFIEELFHLYLNHPDQLPWKYQARIERDGLKQVIRDYIQGMTDRFLQEEYKRAFAPQILI
ncbi:MAG: deoxyguanosinetriphosphate triphosphohydrolase [Candidatus Sumerlaeia bacterium]